MHIASGRTLVRRDPAGSDLQSAHGSTAWWGSPERTAAICARVRKLAPGAVVLMVLAVLGALFPMLF